VSRRDWRGEYDADCLEKGPCKEADLFYPFILNILKQKEAYEMKLQSLPLPY
jgi:hypothetical protein